MAEEVAFQGALKQAIADRVAFCIRGDQADDHSLLGGVVLSKETNEIAWMVVSQKERGKGHGKELVSVALDQLNSHKTMQVQTFDKTVPAGLPARTLYSSFGFRDDEKGGLNPAGIPTVIMRRANP